MSIAGIKRFWKETFGTEPLIVKVPVAPEALPHVPHVVQVPVAVAMKRYHQEREKSSRPIPKRKKKKR